MMSLRNLIGALVGLAFLTMAGTANATVIAESGDAGSSTATAQDVGGSEVTGITGNLGGSDSDFYKFTFGTSVLFEVSDLLPDIGGDFDFDIFNIVLYNSTPTQIAFCGDCWFVNSDTSAIVISINLSPGMYFLEILDTDDFEEFDLLNYEITITTTSIPEPITLALIGTGLAGLGLFYRRRKVIH